MCNISKSMHMSRKEYSLCKVKNTNDTASRKKNDLKSAKIYPKDQ